MGSHEFSEKAHRGNLHGARGAAVAIGAHHQTGADADLDANHSYLLARVDHRGKREAWLPLYGEAEDLVDTPAGCHLTELAERIQPSRQYLRVGGTRATGAIAAVEDFDAVFREHFAPVYRFIARRVGKALAEDLAAEVFATAYRRRAASRPERGSLRSWLYGIVPEGRVGPERDLPDGRALRGGRRAQQLQSRSGPDLDHGVLLTSDDGGLAWQRHAWPKAYGPGVFPDVTCADASHCTMIGFIEHNGTEGNQTSYTSGKDAVQYTVIAFSSDGGVSWTASTLPHTIPYPMMDALTCPTAQTCYAAGSDLIAQRIGHTYNEGSSVVAVTNDAGRTWQRVTFAVPAKVPGGMQGDSFMDIGQIQCPQPDACVAIGVSDQGSTSTPIYTDHG